MTVPPTGSGSGSCWLTAEIVAAVVGHMNADHGQDALLIVRHVGGIIDALAATTADVTDLGMRFQVRTPTATKDLTIPFAQRLTQRSQIRAETVRWHGLAHAAAGTHSARTHPAGTYPAGTYPAGAHTDG